MNSAGLDSTLSMENGGDNDVPLADEWLHVILRAAPDAMLIIDRSFRIKGANPDAELMFGYGPGELTGLPLERLIPERYRDRHRQHQERYFTGPHIRRMGCGSEIMGLAKCGRELLMDVSIRPLQTAQGMFACAAVRDMTPHKTTDDKKTDGDVPARADTPGAASRLAVLTEREWDVMIKVIQGLPNKVIAFEHGVSQRTVEFQRRSMMTKLGVKTVPDLVRLALAARVTPSGGATPSH